ncbi:7-cyano-7-deazaguanine reductase [Oceanospirillum multiglobuliferum]|uniref:NADPH-dependent 7-cyano-7-deazaguanine reductase n=1 Tax=Oceanospirillum multiglobuliferum TaxID=64969 RepID=A0A1T4KKD4_9GAMM|nr:NADPH-dependent 7-cyano-7-deazaguanine reductase QueF [Oceanospirillum multiglobuliferum]OPX56058.1 NADPH-dependent 7-cyano-7-deazaguanine reductase QueF [Oceanospirillum multiglobuliferum]SJZ42837.1 7-cyano-7-deazaguanine reductase [Oceanospirillum multiglobuliferum]
MTEQSKQAQVEDSLLGKQTEYVDQYDPSLLFPIPRQPKRDDIQLSAISQSEKLPFFGQDIWNAFELSWLNPKGKPEVAVATFRVPASSPNIIESKSFKLYLNSFNQTRLTSTSELQTRLEQDLSAAAGDAVLVELYSMKEAKYLQVAPASGRCIDDLDIEVQHYHPEPKLLKTQSDLIVEEQLHSHLLRSNCPVTGQPDWATVLVRYKGKKIDKAGLLAYIISFRLHNDFHEQCVERMYVDIMQHCEPEELTVEARYTRRGGLDINPWRSSNLPDLANNRLLRQ